MEKRGCIKCGHTSVGTKEIAATGTGLSKVFDIQHNHFQVVYCKNCGYAELYVRESSATGNIIDLFLGS